MVNAKSVQTGEYKGHPLLVFGDGRIKFQFGLTKARLLVAAIDELGAEGFVRLLHQFVQAHSSKMASGDKSEAQGG